MQDFYMSGENMDKLLEDLKIVQEKVDSSYQRVEQLAERVKGERKWSGKERDTFLTYFELLQEYHKCFAKGAGKHMDKPLEQAVQGLEEFRDNVDNFYIDFVEYQMLGRIG